MYYTLGSSPEWVEGPDGSDKVFGVLRRVPGLRVGFRVAGPCFFQLRDEPIPQSHLVCPVMVLDTWSLI